MRKYLMVAAALAMAWPVRADDDKKDGDVGPRGPAGIQGPAGVQGTGGGVFGGLVLKARLLDKGRYTVSMFNSIAANPKAYQNITGMELLFKLGESYEEKLIKELEQRLKAQDRIADTFTTSTAGKR